MSSRKDNISNGQTNKVFKSHGLRCNFVDPNSTFASLDDIHFEVNSEVPIASSTFIYTSTASVDCDIQNDIAYSNYLQALLYRNCVTAQIRKHKLALNDQLSIYTEVLMKKSDKKNELECQIEDHIARQGMEELLCDLEDKIEKNAKEFSIETVQKLKETLRTLENITNHVYLNNVKPLKDKEDYAKLQNQLSISTGALTKIINLCGDMEKYQNLNDCLSKCKYLEKEIVAINNNINSSQGDINTLLLETLSEVLFENNANIVINL